MKTLTRTLALVLTLSLVLAGSGYGAPSSGGAAGSSGSAGNARTVAIPAGSERVAENGKLALDFNHKTAEIRVTDLTSGTVWSSNPDGRAEDKIAKGTKKMDLSAQLLVNYVDSQAKPFQLNNFTGSVKSKKFTWSRIDGGIEAVFQFPKAKFTIPVRYTIGEDGSFSAEIVTAGIKQEGEFAIVDINLLPFFGAGSLTDEGYLFVPDGSGALIRFNNGKSVYKSYDDRVYGSDKALAVSHDSEVKEDIKLPVYGLVKGDAAFLAVIHQGAYQAGITAEVSRKSNQYNSVYSYFAAKESESNLILEGSANEKQVVRMSESMLGDTPYEVRYYFLNGEAASYSGMAVRYREYLTEEQKVAADKAMSQAQVPLLIDFLGGAVKRKTFLGIPYKTVEALTSYKDVEKAAELLKSKGVGSLAIRYEGWMDGGALGKMTDSVKAESNLGGTKGFNRLRDKLKEQGVAFYPAINPVSFYKSGNGFYKFFEVAKGISRAPALQYAFRLSDGMKDPDRRPWYLLKPESVGKVLEKFTASAKKKNLTGAALDGIGSTLYSDFRKNSVPKNAVGKLWEAGLSKAEENVGDLMVDQASAYTFPYAGSLNDVPLYSSEFDVEDESVPFYSMAVSGLFPSYSEPVNLSGEPSAYLLKLIETGTYPAYRFIAGKAEQLRGTPYDDLYSAEFAPSADEVVRQYQMVNQALAPVAGQPITGHEKLADGVYRTRYANGVGIVVNYTDEAVTIGGKSVEAHGFAAYEGSEAR